MSEQEKIINLIDDADIRVTDWHWIILDKVTNRYAAGYLSCKLDQLGDSLSPDD